MGTTGVGNGIAIPHGKLPGIDRLYGLFARLETAIDFDAIDEQPVDLIFMLLAPENARRGSSESPGARIAPAARQGHLRKAAGVGPGGRLVRPAYGNGHEPRRVKRHGGQCTLTV